VFLAFVQYLRRMFPLDFRAKGIPPLGEKMSSKRFRRTSVPSARSHNWPIPIVQRADRKKAQDDISCILHLPTRKMSTSTTKKRTAGPIPEGKLVLKNASLMIKKMEPFFHARLSRAVARGA
jgi:hypothetical protein